MRWQDLSALWPVRESREVNTFLFESRLLDHFVNTKATQLTLSKTPFSMIRDS